MDYNNYSGNNNARFAGQPQNQHYPGGMPYYPQQGFPNQRPPMQQNMQAQPQGFQGGFGQGQLPRNPNLQMQQAFNQKQYQKMMEQQHRMAQESQKLQNETRKKKDFEMQQKRLQEFSHGGGKKGGDLSRLIGTLADKGGGTKPAPKQHLATSTGKSLFSRPGGFYQAPQKQDSHEQQEQQQQQHQQYQQQQQQLQQQFPGQQHVQQFPGHSHMQPQPGQSSFPQHPGQLHLQQMPGQDNMQQRPGQPYSQQTGMQTQQIGFDNMSVKRGSSADDDFSDFQEAPSFSGQGSAFPGQQSTMPGQSSAFPGQQCIIPSQSSAFPGQQSTIPSQSSAFPGQQGIIPSQSSAFPGQQSTIPSQSSAFPGQQSTIPSQSSAFPGQQGIIPSQSSAFPGQQSTIPSQSSAFPGQQGTIPGQSSAFPGQQGIIPGQSSAFPGRQGTIPGQSSAFPDQQGTIPGQSSAFPGQQGTIPGQSSAFPGQQGTIPGQSSAFPGQQGTIPGQGNAFPGQQSTLPGQGSSFPGQQGQGTFASQGGNVMVSSSISHVLPQESGPSLPNQSGIQNQSNPSWQMGPIPTSTISTGFNPTQVVFGTSMASGVTATAQATSTVTGPRARTDSQSSLSSNSSSGFLSSQPAHFGQSQNQPSLPGFQGTSFMSQGSAPNVMPGIPGMPGQEQMKQMEQHGNVPGHVVPGSEDDGVSQEEPEDPAKKLYGLDLPEWCRTGKDLPGVYKDVKDAVTLNGAIDTGKLYTVLLTSELHRDILGQLWGRVNKATPGQLNDMELRMMLGMIALGQTGLKVERLTLEKLATCKSAPIPSFPESVFKSEESSWSFQKEPEQENKDSTSSLPVSGNFVGWQGQSSNTYSNTTDPNDKYSVFRMDNTATSTASVTTKETSGLSSGSWSLTENSHANLNQGGSRGTQVLGQAEQSNKLSTSPEFQGFQSAVSSSEADNDFRDFQGSVSSLDSIGATSQQSGLSGTSKEFGFDVNSKLTASLEDFKLKSDTKQQGADEFSEFESFSSAETVTTSKAGIPSHIGSNKPSVFGAFPSIKIPPQAESKGSSTTSISFPNIPNIIPSTKQENKAESGWATATENSLGVKNGGQDNMQTTVDKYSFLKDLDSFSAENTSSRKKDDSFGDFESFEKATHSEDDDFGDFHTTTTESVPDNQNLATKQSQGWGFEGLSSTQPPKAGTNFANFENAQLLGGIANPSDSSATTQLQDDFGDFADFHSSTSSGPTHVNDMPSLFPLNTNFNQDMNEQVKSNNFGVDQSRQRSHSSTSNSFTNTIPLDSTQRYKLLSDEGEDMEKHDNVWGRCLNSCLLTLVTGALAVQKMTDPALKQEVLESKKGIEYFTALTEVFRVTQRIQVSLMKTEFASNKLKDILLEINQSWKNISNFLSGSNIETNVDSEAFSAHHIQADEDKSMACGVCLLNVNKLTSLGTDTKISYGGRDYHATCANFWCNRVDSILPKLLPVNSLI